MFLGKNKPKERDVTEHCNFRSNLSFQRGVSCHAGKGHKETRRTRPEAQDGEATCRVRSRDWLAAPRGLADGRFQS